MRAVGAGGSDKPEPILQHVLLGSVSQSAHPCVILIPRPETLPEQRAEVSNWISLGWRGKSEAFKCVCSDPGAWYTDPTWKDSFAEAASYGHGLTYLRNKANPCCFIYWRVKTISYSESQCLWQPQQAVVPLALSSHS